MDRVPDRDARVTTAIRAQSLSVTYRTTGRQGKREKVCALRSIDLEIGTGSCVGLIGNNGAGKSTLLATLAGAIQPTEGSVLVSEQPHLLGVQPALNLSLSGAENATLGGALFGYASAELASFREAVKEFSELDDAFDRPVSTYSSGMRQRLAFSISTQHSPEILLIDEALSVGDGTFRHKCYGRIDQLIDSARVVMISSHSLAEIERCCNRAIWLDGGRIEMVGAVEEVSAAYRERLVKPN